MNIKYKGLISLSIVSPILYFAASFIVGASNEGYNHIRDSVSDLLVVGMNNLWLMDSMMILSNVFMLIGCFTIVYYFWKEFNKPMSIAFILLGLTGFSNTFSTIVFRLDYSAEGSFSTAMHITFVVVSALFSIISILLVGFNFNKIYKFDNVKLYSIISLLILAGGAMITPIVINSGAEIIGLVERISILGFHQWFIVIVLKLMTEESKIKNGLHKRKVSALV